MGYATQYIDKRRKLTTPKQVYKLLRHNSRKGRNIVTASKSLNKDNMRHEYKFPLKGIKSLAQDEKKMTVILKDETIFFLEHKDFIFKGIGKFLLAYPKKDK